MQLKDHAWELRIDSGWPFGDPTWIFNLGLALGFLKVPLHSPVIHGRKGQIWEERGPGCVTGGS